MHLPVRRETYPSHYHFLFRLLFRCFLFVTVTMSHIMAWSVCFKFPKPRLWRERESGSVLVADPWCIFFLDAPVRPVKTINRPLPGPVLAFRGLQPLPFAHASAIVTFCSYLMYRHFKSHQYYHRTCPGAC